ncbi:lamin tail domain-containing protein [Diaminobutyricimonas aerilata]|uniref:lamin tail domain-containing protein n=1 Tax=Diaminobutyricimonas aerilata TaxID=1162967 RepID=UPI001472C2CC|nr:lamin tail domain-containing protein [Diaminobutyricimonas aerilata]
MTRRLTARFCLAALAVAVLVSTALPVAARPIDPPPVAAPSADAPDATDAPGTGRPDPEDSSAAASTPLPAEPLRDASTVLLSEFANGGPRSEADSFFELRNFGDEPVDLTGWNVYRCNEFGLRRGAANPELDLHGVVLAPGQTFTVARIGAALAGGATADASISNAFPAAGFGLDLVDDDGRRVDSVGVFPNAPWPMLSECTNGRNLPNVLDYAAGESWQRVATTGDPATDYVIAAATPGGVNAERTTVRQDRSSGVRIDEFAAYGSHGDGDDFVELRNTGDRAVDLDGWQLFRCTATGRLTSDALQWTGSAERLAPGDRLVIGGPGFEGRSDARTSVSLADAGSGVLLRDGRGRLVDRVAAYPYADSPCQNGDDKLPAVLDAAADESYQRTGTSGVDADDFVIAPRTPGAANARDSDAVFGSPFEYPDAVGVAVSEIATDPAVDGMPEGSVQRNYLELANYGERAVDISGWRILGCAVDGRREPDPLVTVPDGAQLPPQGTFLAALAETDAAQRADATYTDALDFLGAGVWVEDADGVRVDSVGIYQANEMDRLNEGVSACTKGLSLTTYEPDRLLGETYLRARFTGVDADDFVVGEGTPGEADAARWRERTVADPAALRPVELPVETRTSARIGAAAWRAVRDFDEAEPLTGVIDAVAGVVEGPLTALSAPGERALSPDELGAPVTDDRWGHPYQRVVLDASDLRPGDELRWSGTTAGRNEVQLSVWDADVQGWRMLDAGTARAGRVQLAGEVRAGDLEDGRVTVLVQNGPRTEQSLRGAPDGAFASPNDYDFAVSHLTDTQYLSETYPEVYTGMASWIVANADARKIAFATHTGDLVQNWVDPDQNAVRAEREFERASAIQGILDDAGVPNSVLPGNHDSKRGLDPSLFNAWFGPDRYADAPWYGGSIAPDDNSANFSTFERDGARFLMLSLPYAYGEREIRWAEQVVSAHPDHNVVLSTHEHLTPKDRFEPARRSDSSRWVSRASELWERVVAPNRNVVAVLCGHFHGIGQIVTEDAGGIPGHDVVELLADYQEFRTHTGERATGFQRLLQVDLGGGTIAVDTFSTRLGSTASAEYDYEQFMPDNGMAEASSNARPWRIVEHGLQERYTAEDDEFTAQVNFQHHKEVATAGFAVSRDASPVRAAGATRQPL